MPIIILLIILQSDDGILHSAIKQIYSKAIYIIKFTLEQEVFWSGEFEHDCI